VGETRQRFFHQRGITECVHGDYHAVPEYVASATHPYGPANQIDDEK